MRLRFPDTFWGGFARGWFWMCAVGLPVAVTAAVVMRVMKGE